MDPLVLNHLFSNDLHCVGLKPLNFHFKVLIKLSNLSLPEIKKMKTFKSDITKIKIMNAFYLASKIFFEEANEARHFSQFKALFGTTMIVCQINWTKIEEAGFLPSHAQ